MTVDVALCVLGNNIHCMLILVSFDIGFHGNETILMLAVIGYS